VKLTRQVASAMKCLGGKLEIVASDPDPKVMRELSEEYNCENCPDCETCRKLCRVVI